MGDKQQKKGGELEEMKMKNRDKTKNYLQILTKVGPVVTHLNHFNISGKLKFQSLLGEKRHTIIYKTTILILTAKSLSQI